MIHKNTLKSYAPDARREFIKVVTERAAFYGITENKIFPCEIKGDFAFISGRPFPKDIDIQRSELITRVEKAGFAQTMEEIAYTWFNRFVAIRFMEVNGYLSHGYRVLSHPEGHNEPEILEKAQFIEKLDGLEKNEILKLKTATGKESELYRRLIIAQCNDLGDAMPFLFERVDDPTELLLPDNLLNTDSVIRKMVTDIPEEDWKEVEIVGWLYQFYITEKKDELMKAKKAYKTEEIPAVTQLFTPKWIVKYLVQNSLGAKWLCAYPKSALKEKMEYYVTSAEQSDEVKAKIKEVTPASLNPEELTVMDPACGSGHILVEAYDLLKEIYLERGYRARDIAGLILTKNLFGLEIDERAAQLSGFALLMKACTDDREIFKKGIRPNIICLNESNKIKIGDICRNIESAYTGKLSNFTKDKLAFMDEMDAPLFAQSRTESGNDQEQDEALKSIRVLLELFHDAKTFGSLIRIPEDLKKKLPVLLQELQKKNKSGNLMVQSAIAEVIPFIGQAEILSKRYDCVIANPPYMGGNGLNGTLKEFAKTRYPLSKSDLFAMFIERGFEMAKDKIGYNSMVTMQSWMFLSSYENCRKSWIETKTIQSMAHLGARAFSTISGEVVTVTSFSFLNYYVKKYKPSFLRLIDGNEEEKRQGILKKRNLFNQIVQDDFKKIPGSPIAYWIKGLDLFSKGNIGTKFISGGRNKTHNDTKYLRFFWEISSLNDYWKPYANGGEYRKYFGNIVHVVNWKDSARKEYESHGGLCNSKFWGREGITWSLITSEMSGFRIKLQGCQYSSGSPTIFNEDYCCDKKALAFLNSKIAHYYLKALNPTLNAPVNYIFALPYINEKMDSSIDRRVEKCLSISELDWNSREISLDFLKPPILKDKNTDNLIKSYQKYKSLSVQITADMKSLEEENNRILIKTYGLEGELIPEVSAEEITLFANPKYRYNSELTDDDLELKFKTDTIRELISYALGCMMGRYSLDAPGLVYANAENKGFDSKNYKVFPADEDGIIPISEYEWSDDHAASRFFRFIEITWDKKGLDENLDFVADVIGRKSGEASRDTICRYFVNDFYKDHCQTYKNRPIYWLFTSGKEKAFQALVYLHRYNEGTLARMRTEYVRPLQTKIMRRIEHLEKDKDAASGGAANKILKEIAALHKQQAELSKFDERLRHYADMKIKLDLDEGVKANYGKFGELLEPIKGLKSGPEED